MTSIQPFLFQERIPSIKITNGIIDLIVSTAFGPRILFFGFCGGPNEFFLKQDDLEQYAPDDTFRIYGGHRLWTAPENLQTTYFPENQPLEWEQKEDTLHIRSNAKTGNLVEKEITISMQPDAPVVQLTHHVRNCSAWELRYAPWALSVMVSGGLAVLPLPARGQHDGNLLPNGSLVFWAYTNFADPRWRYGFEYLRVQQDPQICEPLKFGLAAESGWLGYANHGHFFAKQSPIITGADYPDRGTPFQIYLDADILELETMGPLQHVSAGAALDHTETWVLLDQVDLPQNDADINTKILPRLQKYLKF
jgi:hypothetical protein